MYLLELAGEDDAFAVGEAESAATDPGLLAPGVATAVDVDLDRARTLAYTRRVGRLVGTCEPTVDAAAAVLAAHEDDRAGSIAVRASDVRGRTGIDTQAVERRLGQVLVDRGHTVDLESPDHTLLAVFSDSAALGWLAVESRRDFGDRRPTDRPFFQPGSMAPLDARALANIAGAGPGVRLLDPMCGTGGILLEAVLAGADVVGVDAQRKMARGTRRNVAHAVGTSTGYEPGSAAVLLGDATRLPFRDDGFDAVVFDAPYGRQSKIAGRHLEDLVADALVEAHRVGERAVVVGDRRWTTAAAAAGWTVRETYERPVHRSLTRYVLVLDRD